MKGEQVPMPIFDEIRDGCRQVAEKAARVRIDQARLAQYASDFPIVEIGAATLDPATHYLGHGKDTLAFILALDAINFGSGYFPHIRKRPGHSGYFTMAAGLNDWFQAEGAPSAVRLAKLTQGDCARIFGQDLGNPPAAELMGLFAKALNDLGALLLARFDGDPVNLVESAEHKAERLVAALRVMPFFDDVEIWHGHKVPFMKRAQLTAADLGLAFGNDGWGRFDDLDRLTIFADNLVPHVLRVDGVLSYDLDLAARIDREDQLEVGSIEEIEIRAAALHTVELLKQHLHAAGHRHITSMALDYLLWNRGQEARYKAIPRHRARGVFY
jgi:Queuosine salvage protein